MNTITATQARAQFYRLMDRLINRPIRITTRHGNAVLISEADWQAIQETLHLLSVPSMHASLRTGMKTPVAKCQTKLPW